MDAENPGGTPDCPGDKNREGCPCPEEGLEADCWPGERRHRDHGICRDGRTVCRKSDEFGLRWGECKDYVLPQEDALSGPAACGCFSDGTWVLDNLVPCISNSGDYVYSSVLQGDGTADCGTNVGDPPPVPGDDWASTTLNVDCEGQFQLCFTIKSGDVNDPRESDCTLMTQCVDLWYGEAGVTQDAPSLGAWVSSDTQCARAFANGGETHGYGEMTVLGTSIECDAIDDGQGNPYVFHRTRYCPPSCKMRPDDPDCRDCKTGGSGDF
jgi:hypothetical protein